jgi:MFS family permease
VPPTIGLVQQASNLGQFAGPVVLGLWAEHLGWSAAPAIVAPAALLGLAAAFALRRVLRTNEKTATKAVTVPLPRGLQPVPRAIPRAG